MNGRTVVVGFVCGGVGFGLGALVFRVDPTPSSEPVAAARTIEPAAQPPAERPRPTAAPTVAAPTPPSMPPPSPSSEVPQLLATVTQLEDRLGELERQLSIERAIRRGTEGEHIDRPKDLAPRFTNEQLLLSSFSQALTAAGFPATVSSIDCTEHPCIVYGTGFGERGDFDKLKAHLGPYENDSFTTYGFGSSDGRADKRFFGVAVMPAVQGPPDQAFSKRVSYRVNQMHEATKPPAPKP